MIIYHGSENKIQTPELKKGNPKNDYGCGFYCTQSLELSKEWACKKKCDGFTNEYNFDICNLKILDLSQKNFNILHWLCILMQNRTFSPKSPLGFSNLQFLKEKFSLNYTDFDVIIGFRANDSYFSYASDFLENVIPLQSLATAMELGGLGLQIVLKSEKAFKQLTFIKAEQVKANKYFKQYQNRDSNARKNYLERLRSFKPENGIYMIDIVRNHGAINGLR